MEIGAGIAAAETLLLTDCDQVLSGDQQSEPPASPGNSYWGEGKERLDVLSL